MSISFASILIKIRPEWSYSHSAIVQGPLTDSSKHTILEAIWQSKPVLKDAYGTND
jgi:hypothetical protein